MGARIEVKPGKTYRIKCTNSESSRYFYQRYGSPTPLIVIEEYHRKMWDGGWMTHKGNPICMHFAIRSALADLDFEDVWYGHIKGIGELVAAGELEEVNTIET